MKNRFIVIYTIFASAVFIFSMGFFGYNLFNEYSTNLEKSVVKFTELTNDIRTISYSQDENNAAYSEAIKKAVGDASDYSFIQVRRNNETVVLYPTGKSKEETLSKLVKPFTSTLTVNKQSLTVDCNIYLIRPDSIFYYARISFLMILIITIITIVMIIYLNIAEAADNVISIDEESDDITEEYEDSENLEEDKADSEIDDTSDAAESETEVEPTPEPETESESEPVSESEPKADTAAEPAPEPETKAQSEASAASESEEKENKAEVTPEEVKAIFAKPLTDAQVETANDSEPSGLFDPDTGIGWESYLFTRLNNEIDRSTASEIDLSLFIIQLNGINKNCEEFKNVCNYLGIQFQFKDLLFEHKEDSIVAIKISMNVDEALKLADKLYSDICNIINSKECRIGISSRSIRMVTGDRLVLEAEQAIEHSDANSPIIAFRVDSEKYRQLMEQNKGN